MKKRKIIRTSGPAYAVHSSCRAIVLVDSTRLRSAEQKKCQALYDKLEATRKAISLHESESVPEFRKWLHARFGKDLTEVLELEQKVSELQALISSVEEECQVYDIPPWEAYASLMESKARYDKMQGDAGERSRAEFHSEFEGEEQPFSKAQKEFYDKFQKEGESESIRILFESIYGSKKQWKSRRSTSTYEEAFEAFKEQFYDEGWTHGQESQSQKGRKKNNKRREKESEAHAATQGGAEPGDSRGDLKTRLKEQYRVLARRLHPDLNPGLEPKRLELWHQVQQAYAAGNLSRMETLAALSEMFDQSWERITGISTLRSLFQELQTVLRELQKKLRLFKRDESWGFSETQSDPGALIQLENKVRSTLRSDRRALKSAHDEMQALVQSWANPPRRGKRGGAKNRMGGGGAFGGRFFYD